MQDHADVIEAFGGVRPLAEAIGIKPPLATHWARRGIPSRYWILIGRAAATRCIPVTADDLQRLAKIGLPKVEAAP